MTHRLAQSLVFAAGLVFAASGAGAQQTSVHHLAFATHAIARGAVLGADDIEYRDSTSRAPADTSTVSPGWVTRRLIAAGEVLRVPAVEAPSVVSANQPIELEYTDQNLRLTIRGVATRSGSMGERIGVRTESGRRLEGTVVAPGRVRID